MLQVEFWHLISNYFKSVEKTHFICSCDKTVKIYSKVAG